MLLPDQWIRGHCEQGLEILRLKRLEPDQLIVDARLQFHDDCIARNPPIAHPTGGQGRTLAWWRGLCGIVYFVHGVTCSAPCCWRRCCFAPTSRSGSCRRAVCRFCWKCAPGPTRCPALRITGTTTRQRMGISRIARSAARPPPVRSLTSSLSIRRHPSFLLPCTPSSHCTSVPGSS